MADEFAKGLGILTGAGLAWLTLAGWYRTPGFEDAQLVGEVTVENPTIYDTIGLFLMDVFFWFAIIGTFTFWVLIPALEEARRAYADRRES